MAESTYQKYVKDRLREMFPGCMLMKNDAQLMPGVPDLLILFGDRWAALEVKANEHAAVQPNQPYYIEKMKGMSYASFICPENQEEVFRELQDALGTGRETRVSESQ